MIGNIKICATLCTSVCNATMFQHTKKTQKTHKSKPVFVHFNRIDVGMLCFLKYIFFHLTRFSITASKKEQTKLKIKNRFILRHRHVVCEDFDFFLLSHNTLHLFITKKCRHPCMLVSLRVHTRTSPNNRHDWIWDFIYGKVILFNLICLILERFLLC